MHQPPQTPQSPAIYLRERLKNECKTRGRAASIAEATGFSKGHLSNVLKGKTEIGGSFALALVRLWNLDYTELARVEEASAAGAPKLPNLEATLKFCLSEFPKAFLDRYVATARNQSWTEQSGPGSKKSKRSTVSGRSSPPRQPLRAPLPASESVVSLQAS